MLKTVLLFLVVTFISPLFGTNVLFFAGSTRADSLNKKLIREAARMSSEKGAEVTVIDLKNFPIPLYDGDLEEAECVPESVICLRELIEKNDIIFVASPEYNKSVPGVLKNVLDWVLRNDEKSCYQGKLFVLLSASPARAGGKEGLEHLRVILECAGATVYPKPFCLPKAFQAFDKEGNIRNPVVRFALKDFVEEVLSSRACACARP